MDDFILHRLSNVDLQEEEVGCLILDAQDVDDGLKEVYLSILAHIHGDWDVHLEGFKTTMGKAWKCGSFSIQRVDAVSIIFSLVRRKLLILYFLRGRGILRIIWFLFALSL